ncbi:AP-1 complex-associated regulatory protein isoform X2 [Erpetoichthys calabaricus]|uniref:Adaptor related protein complex 1 associated regulatory protein n=1 Tax=Erpetoichthys calabaricus TaxID=27687 RepID=A0A8C4SEP9_ERPCA|nr:AP-1 complex-associated regulatory protein isoform X2 [Erpetoichthys calabaricus]
MGNCWARCCGLFKREATRIQRGGGGSKYFRTHTAGEHFTIEFENLVESDEAESPGSSIRPLSEEEIGNLKDKRYDAIADRQKTVDAKLHAEQRFHRMKQRAHAGPSGDHLKGYVPVEDFEAYLRNAKAQSEAFRTSRVSSETNIQTPNTESSCDFTSKTRSTNEDSTSLDLEWEDEEGMNRMIPVRERSKTEEDILRAALRPGSRRTASNPTSTSEDSNGLEWESDFVGAQIDDNGNSEYAGFVNPVLELSTSDLRNADSDPQDR